MIRETIGRYDEWWSCALLVVELRRLARREGLAEQAERLLSTINLTSVDAAALTRAAQLDPVEVRTLDAIHLDAAIQLRSRSAIDAVLTYDEQLQSGCVHHDLPVEAPAIGR